MIFVIDLVFTILGLLNNPMTVFVIFSKPLPISLPLSSPSLPNLRSKSRLAIFTFLQPSCFLKKTRLNFVEEKWFKKEILKA